MSRPIWFPAKRLLPAGIALLLALPACSGDDDDDDDSPEATPTPAVTPTPSGFVSAFDGAGREGDPAPEAPGDNAGEDDGSGDPER